VIVHDAGVRLDGSQPDPTVAEAAVEEIRHQGGKADAAFEDLAAPGAGEAIVHRIVDDRGRLDALIHSAGLAIRGRLLEADEEAVNRSLAISGIAAFGLLKAAFPAMRRQEYGRIVLTVSGHGLYPDTEDDDLVAYGMAKALQFGLLNAVQAEATRSGILVNAISPVAATRMLTRPVPAGTLTPEHVAPAVAYLASRACNVSGLVVRASGGRFSVGRYAATVPVELGAGGTVEPEAVADAWDAISGGPLHPPS
jgi:NAD(P)-dependent dehydrogenase (short-subunit alcohol dehydrogenase family)